MCPENCFRENFQKSFDEGSLRQAMMEDKRPLGQRAEGRGQMAVGANQVSVMVVPDYFRQTLS